MKLFSKLLIFMLIFSLVLTGCDTSIGEQETISAIEESEALTDGAGLTEDGSYVETDAAADEDESTADESETTTGESETTADEDETTTSEDESTTSEDETTTSEDETTTGEDETTTSEDETTENKEDIIDLDPAPDSEISIKSAIAIGLSYSSNKFTTDKYYVRGEITSISAGTSAEITIKNSYGETLYLYRTYGDNGIPYSSMAIKPRVGDTILVYGIIGQYKGMPEMKDGWIVLIESGSSDIDIANDPYANMSAAEFYANYTPATSWEDAYYRSLHGFMSGSIEDQDQSPTVAQNQPMQDGLFVRNDTIMFSDDGNTYYVVDVNGEVVLEIYRGGGYVVLEEVAAYVFAFGDVPANYVSNQNASPSSSEWGKYLRLNHSQFSGDTSGYPYEPELPNINGCGGTYQYYEIDIGTTGTDCDPSYTAALYNDGYTIVRGAARIVYSQYDINGNEKIEPSERFVFYTYNHYNDFQEYLNYYGGWGEIFGNITGGGTISSKMHYNPTPYVATARAYFVSEYESISICFINRDVLSRTMQLCA